MEMAYVRISSADQNEQRQVEKMKKKGIDDRYIFIDKASGKDFDRPRYQAMKEFIREGDVLYLDSLDRLGRDYDGIIREWKEITREKNADIVALDFEGVFDSRKFKSMDSAGEMKIGKMMEDQFLSLLSFVADAERKKIRQRQQEGIEISRKNGTKWGRPKVTDYRAFSKEKKKMLDELYPKWKNEEITAVQFMKLLDLKKNSFYRMIKDYEEVSK